MTYGFTSTLPARPVPALQDTCRRWLESVRAIQDDDEYRQSEALVTSFLENEGPRLQRYLRLKWLVSSNYVADCTCDQRGLWRRPCADGGLCLCAGARVGEVLLPQGPQQHHDQQQLLRAGRKLHAANRAA